MNKNYQLWYYLRGLRIEEVLVQKANEKSIWLVQESLFDGEEDTFKRVGLTSYWGTYFPTLELAVAEQKRIAQSNRAAALEKLEEADKILASIEANKIPVRKHTPQVKAQKGQKILI